MPKVIQLNEHAADSHWHLCDCDSHGYTQGDSRWGDAWRGNCVVSLDGRDYNFWKGDRDCSSSVIDVWREVLRGTPYEGTLDGATYTGNMRRVFVNSGLFEWGAFDADRINAGDIVLNEVSHTAMYQHGWKLSEFYINEHGGITGGQSGDQTGRESWIRDFYEFPWDGVLYYNGKADITIPDPEPTQYDIITYGSHGKDNQKWILNSDGTIESVAHPGFVLDVCYGEGKNGAPVILYKKNGGDNQRWIVEDGGIRSALGDFWLDVMYASDEDCSKVEIWERNNTDAQKWVLLTGGDGYVTIMNNHTNAKKCLDVSGG